MATMSVGHQSCGSGGHTDSVHAGPNIADTSVLSSATTETVTAKAAQFPAPPLAGLMQGDCHSNCTDDAERVADTPASTYKQLIFGHEANNHEHWDEERGSVVRIECLKSILRLLQQSFQQQRAAAGGRALQEPDMPSLVSQASDLEEEVYRLHVTPHSYIPLIGNRRALRSTLVHVYEIQDKIMFLRRLLRCFVHYMKCGGCSRPSCREFRRLGDHAVECPTVQALLNNGVRYPCPYDDTHHECLEDDDDDDADDELSDHSCSSPNDIRHAHDSAIPRHCDILKSLLFHNISCERSSCRVCSDIGCVLPERCLSRLDNGSFYAPVDLKMLRSLIRRRASQRRRHLQASTLVGMPVLKGAEYPRAKPARGLSIISEESCPSCSEVEDDFDHARGLKAESQDTPVLCPAALLQEIKESAKTKRVQPHKMKWTHSTKLSGLSATSASEEASAETPKHRYPRVPFLQELHSRCRRKD